MKKLTKLVSILTASALALAMLTATAFADTTKNLLKNGSAADGLKGWTTIDDHWATGSYYDGVTAYEGDFFYTKGYKGSDNVPTYIYQDVSVKKYVGMKATLSAYNRAYSDGHTDESVLKLEFRDSTGKVLDSGYVKSSKDAKWHRMSVGQKIPEGAVTARIYLCAIYHTGSEADAYFDNVEFTVSGTPTSTTATLSYIQVQLKKGATMQLAGIMSDSSEGKVTWSSSKTSVATVSSKGKVTARSKGTAVITAKSGAVSLRIMIKVTA